MKSALRKILRPVLAPIVRNTPLHRFSGGVPKRYVTNTAEWVEMLPDDIKKGIKFELISDPDVTEQPGPHRISQKGPDRYAWNRPWRNYGTFLLEADSLRFDTITQSLVTSDHTLLYDLSRQWPDDPDTHALMKVLRLPKHKVLDGTSLLLSVRDGGWSYFNWMTLLLPRICLLWKSGYRWEDIDRIIVNSVGKGFQKETLSLLGVPMNRVFQSDGAGQLLLSRAIVPSHPYQAGFVRRWAIDFLKDQFLNPNLSKQSVPKSLIYISRGDARTRRVLNEDELLNRLERLGFEAVEFTGKSVSEQAQIMSEARCVVAPHGAGLTNLVFAPDGIDVVEFHALDYYSSSFWWISTRMGNRHAVLNSLPDSSGSPYTEQSIRVDIDLVLEYLSRILSAHHNSSCIVP